MLIDLFGTVRIETTSVLASSTADGFGSRGGEVFCGCVTLWAQAGSPPPGLGRVGFGGLFLAPGGPA